MHIDRADEIAMSCEPAGTARPISAFGLVSMPAPGTAARCTSFGAGEAQDAGLFGFVGEIVKVTAEFPQGHALVVMPTAVPVAHAVRIADEETSDRVLDTEVNDRLGRFMAQIADAPLRSMTDLVLGALQLLPTAGVLRAATLLFGELAQLSQSLPLERADAAPGHDQGGTRARGHGGEMNFSEVYRRLDGAGSLLCSRHLDADMQFKAPIPDQGTRPGVFGKIEGQDERWVAPAHWQDHPPLSPVDSLGGPLDRVELLGAPGILHPHLRVRLAQLAGGLDIGEEGVDDHLHGLAMQPVLTFRGSLQRVPPWPLRMREARLLVHLHAKVLDMRRLLLCGLQFVQLVRRQVIESVDAHGFHRYVFFFSAQKAVMCHLERYPFTIILKREVQCPSLEPLRLKKGTQDIVTFLVNKPEVLARILAQAKAPLKDAAAVNTTRWALYRRLRILGLPIECSTGGRTKYNRVSRGLEKAHWLDAACVGKSTPEHLEIKGVAPLLIKACGHGCRQLCLMDKHGFPRTKAKQKRFTHGFRSGDTVRADVPSHLKNPGTRIGRMSAKANGAFTITTGTGTVTDIGKNYCRTLQRADGYGYLLKGGRDFLPIS